MSFGNTPGWFALTVRPNQEHTASRGLSNQGLETYLPVYRARKRWSEITRCKKGLRSLFFSRCWEHWRH